MDAQMVTAIFTALAAFAALGTAIAAFLQIRMSRQSISVDVLLRLDAHFNSPDMKTIRSNAAAFLLKYQFGQHHVLPIGNRIALESLLDFFEGIASLSLRKGTPDPESVWCFFFPWIERYCWAAERFIKETQKNDPLRWQDLIWLHKQLEKIERKYRPDYKPPDEDQLRRFLKDEAELSV